MSEAAMFVTDDGDLRKYRTETPNIVCDLGLGPHAGWLYIHLKRIAGDSGVCWRGTRSLAEVTGMSVGAVSQAKKELKKHGLIAVDEGDRTKGEADEIRIANVWRRNFRHFDGHPRDPRSSDEHPARKSDSERVHDMNTPFMSRTPLSQYEHKKEPLEEVTNKSTDVLSVKPKKLKVDDSEAEARWLALLEDSANANLLRTFADFRALQNKNGEIKLATLWRQIGEEYSRSGLTEEALRYGLTEALRREKPSIRYVLAVARNHKPGDGGGSGRGRQSIAVVGATEADYDLKEYDFNG